MNAIFSKSSGRAIGLGAVAGMRAMSAPALLSHFISKSNQPLSEDAMVDFLQTSNLSTILKGLALAEIIADKLPKAPDRISLPSLLVRTMSGAVVGATLSEPGGERKIVGAFLGGIGAIAASFTFFYLRKKVVHTTGLPDATIAIAEDVLAIWAGAALLKT